MPKRRSLHPPRRRWFPTWKLWPLFALYLGAIVWLHLADPMGDRGSVNVFTYLLVILALFTWMIWFLLASGQRWWVRLLPWALVAAVVFVGGHFFRLERVSGEMIPEFVRRDAVKAHAELEVPTAAGPAVDLVTTTPHDFPQFLGPERLAAVENVTLDPDWETQPPELVWRQPIGAGWSGFAVVNGHAVTLEQRGDQELVTCYSLADGTLEWSHAEDAHYASPVPGDGPRSTPTIAGGVVYTLGATGILLALDGSDGAVLWRHDLAAEQGLTPETMQEVNPYGYAASPLVVDDLVIVPAGGPAEGPKVSLIAFDRRTGKRRWEGGESQLSCSSPALARLGGVDQVLEVNEASVAGHDLADGRLLWEHPWPGRTNGDANVSQPVPLPPDRVFVSKGYGLGAAVLRLEASGGGTFEVEELWHEPRVLRTKFTNVAISDGYAYGLSDGILECVDLATGERAWKRGRYKQGQLLRVGGHLQVLSEDGEVVLVEATPEEANRVLGRFQAIEGQTWNTFALYRDRLLVRNAQEAACYRLPLV